MSTAATYRKLLAQYVPQPIRTEKDYKRRLTQLEKLMVPNPGPALSQLIEVLSILIEQYETREFPCPKESPSTALAGLLESRNITRAHLAKQTGIPAATISSVLSGERGISKANVVKLAMFFNVSPSVFLSAPVPTP